MVVVACFCIYPIGQPPLQQQRMLSPQSIMSLACPYAAQPPTLWSQVPSDGQANLLLIQDNVKSLESAITWLSRYMLFPSSTTKHHKTIFVHRKFFFHSSDLLWCLLVFQIVRKVKWNVKECFRNDSNATYHADPMFTRQISDIKLVRLAVPRVHQWPQCFSWLASRDTLWTRDNLRHPETQYDSRWLKSHSLGPCHAFIIIARILCKSKKPLPDFGQFVFALPFEPRVLDCMASHMALIWKANEANGIRCVSNPKLRPKPGLHILQFTHDTSRQSPLVILLPWHCYLKIIQNPRCWRC